MQTIEGFTTSELIIDEVEPEDAGKYTVMVENLAGQAVCEAELTVVGEYFSLFTIKNNFFAKILRNFG